MVSSLTWRRLSNLPRGRGTIWEEGRKIFSRSPSPSLDKRYKPRGPSLGTFDTKMSSRNSERSISTLFNLLLPESVFRRMISANPGLVSMTTYLPCLYLNLELELVCLRITRSWGTFVESADNISGPKSYFMFAAFAFMANVLIILTMIQSNY